MLYGWERNRRSDVAYGLWLKAKERKGLCAPNLHFLRDILYLNHKKNSKKYKRLNNEGFSSSEHTYQVLLDASLELLPVVC